MTLQNDDTEAVELTWMAEIIERQAKATALDTLGSRNELERLIVPACQGVAMLLRHAAKLAAAASATLLLAALLASPAAASASGYRPHRPRPVHVQTVHAPRPHPPHIRRPR
jgi:hypothetical protein